MDNLFVKLRVVLSVIVPLCYIFMGVYVAVEKIFVVKIKPEFAYPLGIVLVLYGLFRIYRAWAMLKENKL